MFKPILLLLMLFFIGVGYAEETLQPLPAAEAFKFSTTIDSKNQLVLQWNIGADYYLYRDKLRFTVSPAAAIKVDAASLPKGHEKHDAIRGNYTVYTGLLNVLLQGELSSSVPVKLDVKYQGCSTKGFCYPPITQHLLVDLTKHTVSDRNQVSTAPISENVATRLLSGQHYWTILLGFLGLGLLLAFTPCVLPMIPIISGIIVGYGQEMSTRKAFFLALAYVLGLALAYAAAGIIVALAGSSVQAALQKPWMIEVFSGMFVILSLSLFGMYELKLPNKWQGWLIGHSNRQKGGTYVGVFFMGALSTLIVSPCVSAPLVGVLGYIANTGDIVFGGTALLALGLGMGIPLLIIGTSAGKLLPKTGAWMDVIKELFGLMMLGLAIWMLARIWSASVIMILWALLAIFASLLFWRFKATHRHWHKVNRALGLAFLLYGVVLLISSMLGNSNPLTSLFVNGKTTTVETTTFLTLNSMKELDDQLAQAKTDQKQVLLDFYADWCVSCVIMDKTIFNKADVKNALKKFILLRADVTKDNEFDQALMKRFNVVAPPTVLFFDEDAQELSQKRIVGEVTETEFLKQLN